MEAFTLTRGFLKRDIIDGFKSIIWTERYAGDSEVELVVSATSDMIKKLPEGTFLGIDGSDEIMILETADSQDNNLKLTGISLFPWLNNRFVRASAAHKDEAWTIGPETPGWLLQTIISSMCMSSPYTDGTINIGITNPQQLVIPGLHVIDYDKTGEKISVAVPYGPVYDAMRDLAATYAIGQQIILESASDTAYSIGYRNYRGIDHTSGQTVNPVIRFSPLMDSFTNIHELRSIAALKTRAYAFAPGATPALATTPGFSSLMGATSDDLYTGFDLRAQLILASDLGTDITDATVLLNLLNSRAKDAIAVNHYIKAVDGEIVPTSQFRYGVDYNLGDLIEVQGNSEIVSKARITEYIRSQDNAGEKAYPTVTMLD